MNSFRHFNDFTLILYILIHIMNDSFRMVFAGSFLAGPFQPFCYFPISVEITDESLFSACLSSVRV